MHLLILTSAICKTRFLHKQKQYFNYFLLIFGVCKMDSFSDIWKLACDYMKTELNINDAAFNLWIKPLVASEFTGTTAVLICNSEFKLKIITEKYDETIKKALCTVTGFDEIETSYMFRDDIALEKEVMEQLKEMSAPLLKAAGINGSTFESFIVGSTNKFAYAAALNAAEHPGENYNPLFIYGKSGLGKTHLLKAIERRMFENNPDMNVLYTTSENFTNDLIYHLESKNMSEFHTKYRTADALLIDDIQFIANKKSTEEEFFHTFNALTEVKRQIVLTSDNPPTEIPTLQERLKTRFSWGITADITPPDFETRIAIIKSKAAAFDLNLSDEVLAFIAEQVKHNIRQLEGAVNKLNAIKQLTGENLTLQIAQEAIKEVMNLNQPISVINEKIVENVASTFGVSSENIMSDKRDKNIKDARQITMYIIREITGLSLVDIGKLFGGKTHSTVKHSIDVIRERMDDNINFKKTIDDIIKNVQEF